MAISYREHDTAAWREWKRAPNSVNLGRLLQQLNPIIQREVGRWVGTLARPALELEAKKLAAEAIESYSPTAGAALATHVTNRLKKLSRLSYTHQNIARIPEYQTLKFRTFTDAQMELADKFGREPTADELADELRWSNAAVANFQTNLRREFVESGELPPHFDQSHGTGGEIDFIYHDLTPMQKKIFEHTTGYGGARVLNNPQLTEKLELTQGQLSYQKRALTNRFESLMGKTHG